MNDRTPVLIVDAPPGHEAARRYILSVLLTEWLRLPCAVRIVPGLRETRFHLPADDTTVVAVPDGLFGPATDWLSAASLPADRPAVSDMPAWTERSGSVPLLYAAPETSSLVKQGPGRYALTWDLLGSLFFLLTRYEEYVGTDRDAHGRYPASRSALVGAGWHQWPVSDMYLHTFAAILRLAWPRLDARPAPYAGLAIGHDVDHPSSSMLWRGTRRGRVVAGDLFRRRSPGLAIRRASAFMPWSPPLSRRDPLNTYDTLMRTSEAARTPSTFFFLAADTATPHGSVYRVSDPWARTLIREISGRGHRVGLHGSYGSHVSAVQLGQEWAELERACAGAEGSLRRTVRQHFLRWEPGTTWSAQAGAGLEQDETLAYADTVGFRAGTARSFPAYDIRSDRALALHVQPLLVMDGALAPLAQLDDLAAARVMELQARTKMYGGTFSLLWHNSSIETQDARRRYAALIRALSG